jgi:hypothetical protein
MKSILGLFLVSILFSGCRAHMMETHGNEVRLFKTGLEKPGRGGVIRFLNTGLDAWKKARRKDAGKQMAAYCGGPYTITAEGPRSQFGAAMPIGPGVSLEVDQYTYIAFECEKQKP